MKPTAASSDMAGVPGRIGDDCHADSVCVAAIAKAEGRFIDEWLAYHRLIGVDQFLIYDDDVDLPLKSSLQCHSSYVRVIPWPATVHSVRPGRNRQTKAYEDALKRAGQKWIAFIDIDEFIVLRQFSTLQEFLSGFADAGAVVLSWHVFGHNGYFDDPPGLITETLTRRRQMPSSRTKCINRREAIASILTAHSCRLKPGYVALDANRKPYTDQVYDGKTAAAHINHYMCRSFMNWMGRVSRGEVAYSQCDHPDADNWRYEQEACLRKFVEFTKDTNEYGDEFLVRYAEAIKGYLAGL